MMCWVHSDVGCLDDDLVGGGGGTGYALGIVVGCMACLGCMFVCLWNKKFDGYGVVSSRSDNVVRG